jgi:type I restriction enzyme S subunit
VKTAIIRSTWMESYGYRLDCQPYLGGALEAKILLERLPLRKDKLSEVTTEIYHAGRESRLWVDSPDYGVPFLGAGHLQRADFSDLPLISRRQVDCTPRFVVRKGWSLITRSGTVGKMAYARTDMDGLAVSEDVLRVVPDLRKIRSGYLYAYLCSKFGVPLVASGTYGAIIQHLEPEHIANLPVPRLDDALEYSIHNFVEEAAELRVKAKDEITSARSKLRKCFGQPPQLQPGERHPNWSGVAVPSKLLNKTARMDALFFNPVSRDLDEWLARHPMSSQELGAIADVFDVPPFKHIYVAPEEGIAFFTSADLFDLDRTTDKYLSRQTRGLDKYILQHGWVLIARSGQLNGNIGKPQLVDTALSGSTASDHVIRIVSRDKRFSPGYLYAYLSLHEWRYSLIQRTATGASIPALWPAYLKHIRILCPPSNLNREVDVQVRNALEMRVQATGLETEARQRLEAALSAEAN